MNHEPPPISSLPSHKFHHHLSIKPPSPVFFPLFFALSSLFYLIHQIGLVHLRVADLLFNVGVADSLFNLSFIDSLKVSSIPHFSEGFIDSFYIYCVQGNINLEDELFSVSENSPLLVKDSPLNDEVATSKKKSTRGINFSAEEDKLLVAAWLNTSVDLVYGNEQHKRTLYGKVAKYFKDHKTDSTRRISSLTSQWGTINRETVKFCGSLAKIEVNNESGTTADDKIEKARELFKEIHDYFFQYEHCWLMLKDFPKWATTMPVKIQEKKCLKL